MSTKQKTIKNSISLNGVGLHTGEKATITFKTAPENHGFVFQRIDLDGKPTIKADCDLVVDTSRGTTIEQNGARVYTTEHLLAAAYGLEIDNLTTAAAISANARKSRCNPERVQLGAQR